MDIATPGAIARRLFAAPPLGRCAWMPRETAAASEARSAQRVWMRRSASHALALLAWPMAFAAMAGTPLPVHVQETGSDYATVADALADPATAAGMTVQLATGTHAGPIVLNKAVKLVGAVAPTPATGPSINAGVTVPPVTIIDGGNAVADGIVIASGVTGAWVSGLEIRNFTRHCIAAGNGNDGLLVEQNLVHHCGGRGISVSGIAAGGINNVTIDHNEIHATGDRGIVVWDGVKRDITITDNWVHDLNGCCGIELQDGTATGAQVTDNVIENTGDSGMAFIQLTSGSPSGRPNAIARNDISNTGRFGIEIKIPNGSGAATGDGAIVVEDNIIVAALSATNPRDRAGIAVMRRSLSAAYPFEVDASRGVIVRNNQVSGFKTGNTSQYEGYGIVVEGLGSSVSGNTLADNDVGLQIQQGNPDGLPPGDSDQNAHSDWFGRGNAPLTCISVGAGVDANQISASTLVDQRQVPAGTPMIGARVLNQNTGARYCSINAAIAAALPGETLVADPGVYVENVVVDRAISLHGAQAGTPASLARSSDPLVASIIVPPTAASGMAYNMNATLAVMSIEADGVTVDGFVLDGDNPAITTGLPMGSADPDVDTGVFASGSHIQFVNNEVRNLVYGGYVAYNNTAAEPAREGNAIAHNWLHNLDAPSSWGVAIVLMWNYYADIHDNQITDARIGVQTNYFFKTAPVPADARIVDNTIEATTTGIYHNYHVNDSSQASPFTISGNAISASGNPAGAGVWTGLFIQNLDDASSATFSGNTVDGSAFAGSGRLRLGYGIGMITTSLASSLAIDGGSVGHVDYGVLATDGAYFAGRVDDFTVRNVAFSDVAIAAIAVEDTRLAGTETVDNAVRLTVGSGNTFASDVVQHGSLSGPQARIEFASGANLLDRMLVQAAGPNYRGALADSNGNLRTVDAGVINDAIADVAVNGTVTLEAGAFVENVIVGKALTLGGAHAGTAGNDGARGAGESVLRRVSSGTDPTLNVPLSINSGNVIVDGIEIDGVTGRRMVQSTSGATRDGIRFINNRLLNYTSSHSTGVGINVGGTTGLEIAGNLFQDFANGSAGNQWAMGIRLDSATNALVHDNVFRHVQSVNIQLSQNNGSVVRDNDIDGVTLAGTGNAGIQLATSSNVQVRGNTIARMDSGLLVTPGNAVSVSLVCNSVTASSRGLYVMGSPWSGSHTIGPILHNSIEATTLVQTNWAAGELLVGSNWYGGATASSALALIADPLPANPIGNALCGNNASVQIVAHAGSGQSTTINSAFSQPLVARVVDALGGAVVGQPIDFSAVPVNGASAALGTSSGSGNHNGVLASTAAANGIAGSYTVSAHSGSLSPDAVFNLTNNAAIGTVVFDNLSLVYNGTAQTLSAHVAEDPTGVCTLTPASVTNAGNYPVTASCSGDSYVASGSATAVVAKATGTVAWGTLSFVYDGNTPTVTATIAQEPVSSCTVTGAVGPNVGSYPVSASCTGTNYDASGNSSASVTPASASVTLSYLIQAYDGSPKSVVVNTTPSGLATSVTYNGSTAPPTAVGSYAVVATVTDPNYTGSASDTLEIVNGSGDIALVLNGTVDPIHVGDLATYAATMLANPALHDGETFGYKVTLGKSGGNHPLDLADLVTMEIFYQGAWVDAEAAFGAIPFTMDGFGNLVYQFPDGIPGYPAGFPILDPSWTWNVRFSFADTGTYTTTAELVDGVTKVAISPAVTASISTVVVDALPPTDIQLVLAGPAESVAVGAPAEYVGTMLADPSLHAGENFFVKVNIAKTGGTHALDISDLSAMEIYLNGNWQALPPGDVSQVGAELVYLFPQSQMPGGFPIEDAEWSWNFRFTYADTGSYTATARVINAADAADPAAHAFDTAAISTTVVDAQVVIPDMGLLLLGPVDAVPVGEGAEYTGTLLADPDDFVGRTFWVRVRLSKNGGADPMTVADLTKMELYQGGVWNDATALLQPELVQDGNDLVYLFPRPNPAFAIDAPVWSWRFRFTYAGEGLYGAVADVVDAAEADPYAAASLANASTATNVVAGTAGFTLDPASLAVVYDGAQHGVAVSTTPVGLAWTVVYTDSASAVVATCTSSSPAPCGPVDAGSYTASVTIDAGQAYTGAATASLVIAPAVGTLTFGATNYSFDGLPHDTTALIAQESGNSTACTLSASDEWPRTNAGSTLVTANCVGTNYSVSGSTTLVVSPKALTITLTGLGTFAYDGATHAASASADGEVAGFPATLVTSYNGGAALPLALGHYNVLSVLDVASVNYSASPASGTITIVAGAANAIAANGAIAFTGVAGQPLAGALPSVRVTDAGGNPVANTAVTFSAGAGDGLLSGATQTTDSNGVATLGGWILDATPGTDTLSASAAGVAGTIEFTASSTAATGTLSVTIDDGHTFAQYGQSLGYTITVGNAGSSNLVGVAVSALLPDELDVATAQWQCIPVNGAICTAGGSGDLLDSVDLPAGSSVVYLLDATAIRGPSDRISTTISATGPDGAVSATDITDVVLFRDGFELGGDGAESIGGGFAGAGELAGTQTLELAAVASDLGSLRVNTLAQARDGAFRIEAIRIGDQVWLRLVARAAAAEQASAWSRVEGERVLLAIENGDLLLAGTADELSIRLERSGSFTLQGPVLH